MISENHKSLLHLESNAKSKLHDEKVIANTLFLKVFDMFLMKSISSR